MDDIDRVSKAVVILEGTVESKEEGDDVDEEKLVKFGENSLVEKFFEFFFFISDGCWGLWRSYDSVRTYYEVLGCRSFGLNARE